VIALSYVLVNLLTDMLDSVIGSRVRCREIRRTGAAISRPEVFGPRIFAWRRSDMGVLRSDRSTPIRHRQQNLRGPTRSGREMPHQCDESHDSLTRGSITE